jgi:hypothetical protein
VRPDHSLRWDGKLFQIDRQGITDGLRGANVRVEQRLDGSLAVRYEERYLPIQECAAPEKRKAVAAGKLARTRRRRRGSDWNQNFDLRQGPKVWQAAQASGYRKEEACEG